MSYLRLYLLGVQAHLFPSHNPLLELKKLKTGGWNANPTHANPLHSGEHLCLHADRLMPALSAPLLPPRLDSRRLATCAYIALELVDETLLDHLCVNFHTPRLGVIHPIRHDIPSFFYGLTHPCNILDRLIRHGKNTRDTRGREISIECDKAMVVFP